MLKKDRLKNWLEKGNPIGFLEIDTYGSHNRRRAPR
ncbi:MAG: hypothetical protein BWX91_00326 [Spirochaetes bacterium ADurb.Bin133]|jgi:hypothetical protein|nr:MAG: hypothetical protein BWX91_00326 [Spirochaetes bacterium ADurb.Bin133]